MKKLIQNLLVLGSLATLATGCNNGGNQPSGDESKDVHVKLYLASYGKEWLEEAIKAFKKVPGYTDYNVILDEASTEVSNAKISEIKKFNQNDTDIYFLNANIKGDLVKASASTLRSEDKVLMEDLSDVYNSKAIGADGKEESETIASRMFKGYEESCQYNGKVSKWGGKLYNLPWADAMTGLLCNTAILDKYGLEIPLTTDDLKKCFDAIESHTAADNIYAYGWAGSNQPAYWSYLFETWFAQYAGQEEFVDFIKCGPADKIKNEGYKVYQKPGIEKALDAIFPILNNKYAPAGSASMIHSTMHNQFMQGHTAFIVDGDWVACEMKRTYPEESKKMSFLRTPIISSLGPKVGLANDKELHDVIKMIDDKKSDAEIKAAFPVLDDAKVFTLRNARGVHDCIGTSHNILIPSMSNAKTGAKAFIRFLYSDAGCNIWRKYTLSNLPLKYNIEEGNSDCTFTNSLDAYVDQSTNPSMISGCADYNDVRTLGKLYLFNNSSWLHPLTFANIMTDQSSGDPKLTPNYVAKTEAEYVESNWAKYVKDL